MRHVTVATVLYGYGARHAAMNTARAYYASTLQTAWCCSNGMVITAPATCYPHQGLLTTDGQRVLSGLGWMVFSPALSFTKLAAAITPQRLAAWWPLLANMAVT